MIPAILLAFAIMQAAAGGQLKIVVVEGEGAVNIIQQKTAVAPVVEVRDRNDQPVAGAVVRFAIQKGRASFNGARTLSVTTNAAGRATAAGLTPTGSGALQIGTSVAFQGQTAVATIAQVNVLTAAQASTAAAAGGGAAGGGGGLSHTALAAILGGAGVVGGVVAAKRTSAETFSPAGTWSYALTGSVPLNSGLLSCPAQSSGTTVVAGDGSFSIPFASLACQGCSMSGMITGTILSRTSVGGSATASITGSGCSSQQLFSISMSGECVTEGAATRCTVHQTAGSNLGLLYTLARP